jgi:hypothetical protein
MPEATMNKIASRITVLGILMIFFIIAGCQQAAKVSTTAPCTGKVKKVVRGNDVTYQKLSCTGTCPDGSNCKWLKSTDHHGATREWCGCGTTEPTDECFLVFYTPGQGAGGNPEVVCPPRDCPDGQTCKPKETLVAESDESKVYEVTCSCQ